MDGGRTTQPQFSFWFRDVAWDIENYGVDPDITVDNDPASILSDKDLQLERAILEVMRLSNEMEPIVVNQPKPKSSLQSS